MRTMTTATMMLLATMMIAPATRALGGMRDGSRPSPTTVSSLPILGTTHDLRALSTLDMVRIQRLPVTDDGDGLATVPILVEPRVLASRPHRALLSVDGEPVSERSIAPGSSVILEARIPADGLVHSTCVSVQRVLEAGPAVQAAQRCFEVLAPTGGQF